MVTISGGRSSAMMARHIQTNEKYKDYEKVYVFCNTGMERPETIQFLKDIEKHWQIPIVKIEGIYSGEMGQGVKTTLRILDFHVGYLVNPSTNFNILVGISNRSNINAIETLQTKFIYFGIRTSLNNIYYDF